MEEDIVYSPPDGVDDQRCYEDSNTSSVKHIGFFDTRWSARWLMGAKVLLWSVSCW